jgi:hypothetical protein
LALSAIDALGEDATRSPWQRPNGNDPVDALLDLQHSSGGFTFVAGGKPNGFSTRQAVVGMASIAYPIPPMSAPVSTPEPKKDQADATEAPSSGAQATSEPDDAPEATGKASASVSLASATPDATAEAAGFDPPAADPDDDSSILTSPFLWAAVVGGAGLGTGVALWYRRRRALL